MMHAKVYTILSIQITSLALYSMDGKSLYILTPLQYSPFEEGFPPQPQLPLALGSLSAIL